MLGLAELFDRGGPVLYILFIVTLFIWFIIFSKYLSTSYNNKNWIKNNFDTFSNGVNINRSNKKGFYTKIKNVGWFDRFMSNAWSPRNSLWND